MRKHWYLLVCLAGFWGDAVNADLQVTVHDQNRGPVDNAVVSVYPADSIHLSDMPGQVSMEVMDQQNKQFIPYVLAVRTGTPVSFPNSDNIRHQVYSFSPAKIFKLPLYHDTPTEPVVFDKAGVVILGCNIHDQMIAYIYIVDTEYFAKVEHGKAVVPGLDAGRYEVTLWHPAMAGSEIEKKVVEITDKNSVISISFDIETELTGDNPSTLTPFEKQFKDLLRETN